MSSNSLTERIERAARAAEDTAVISMGDYEVMNWRAVVRAVLAAAYPELFAHLKEQA